jgi:translation initiation factor 4A
MANSTENDVEIEVYESFDSMNLDEKTLRGIYSYGFERPSAIQQRVIKPILNGNDVIGQAQSGTGKTGSFVIPMIQIINYEEPTANGFIQGLIMGPTRELANQIQTVAIGIGEYYKIKVYSAIGKMDINEDKRALNDGIHLVVGTPGRIFDLINRKMLKLDNIKLLVIDEADVMLEHGFREQLYEIFNMGFPSTMKVALFSATMTADTHAIADKFMKNPIKITLQKEEVNLAGIQQYRVPVVKEDYKFDTLLDLMKIISISQAIIFCNTKQKVMTLLQNLIDMKQSIICIHSEMEQKERNDIMKKFRTGEYRILISTDITARGIDVQQVSLVINYDIPRNRENYMHRIGRCGRFGRKGVALNFVTESDAEQMKSIDEFYHLGITNLPEDVKGVFL